MRALHREDAPTTRELAGRLADRLGHLSSWPDPEGRAAYEGAYRRVVDELWPVPAQSLFVDTRYGRTHVLVAGPADAPPVVVFHGAGLSATSWYPNIAAVAEQRRVYAPDTIFDRGLGGQTAPVRGAHDCAEWAIDLLDALELRQPSLVGLSQGGWVAASAARHHPERVARLALLAPVGTLRAFRAPFWFLFRGGQDLLPQGDPRRRAARVFAMVGLAPEGAFFTQVALGSEHFREQRPPVFPTAFPDSALGALTMPVLLLVAEREVLYDPRKALTRARALIPHLTADVVPAAGHFVAMAAPEFVDERLVPFLAADLATARLGTNTTSDRRTRS